MIFIKKNTRIRVAGLICEDNKVLLVAHKKNNKIYWLLPGGGVDYNESLVDALERELHEELGISINIDDIALICDSIDPTGKRHILHIVFYCSYKDGEYTLGMDKRLYKYKYFDKDEIQNLTIFPNMKNEIIQLLDGEEIEKIYKGKIWVPL